MDGMIELSWAMSIPIRSGVERPFGQFVLKEKPYGFTFLL